MTLIHCPPVIMKGLFWLHVGKAKDNRIGEYLFQENDQSALNKYLGWRRQSQRDMRQLWRWTGTGEKRGAKTHKGVRSTTTRNGTPSRESNFRVPLFTINYCIVCNEKLTCVNYNISFIAHESSIQVTYIHLPASWSLSFMLALLEALFGLLIHDELST